MKLTTPSKIFKSESGSMLILAVAVIFPIIVLILSVGFDVSNLFTLRATEQKVLDSAVLYGVRQLPNKPMVEDSIKRYLSTHSFIVRKHGIQSVSVSAENDRVQAHLSAPFSLPWAKFFGFEGVFNHHLYANARTQPKDIGIYFDSSMDVMPSDLDSNADDANPAAGGWWGKQAIIRNTSGTIDSYNNYFMFTNVYNDQDSRNWREARYFRQIFNGGVFNGSPTTPPRTALKRTQICFNPTYSAIKEAVIRYYYQNSQIGLNSVGVFTGPSSSNGIFEVRPVIKGGYRSSFPQAEGVLENASYSISTNNWRDRHCVAAAQVAEKDLVQWRATQSQATLDTTLPDAQMRHAYPHLSPDTETNILNHNGAGVIPNFVDETTSFLNQTLRDNNLSLREAVWGRRAHPNSSLGIKEIIEGVGLPVLNSANRVAERGELVNLTTKQVLIILGHLPRSVINGVMVGYENATTAQRTTIRNRMIAGLDTLHSQAANLINPLSIYIHVVMRDGQFTAVPCPFNDCSQFRAAQDEIKNAITTWEASHPKVRVQYSSSEGQDLVTTVQDYLSISERQVYLGN
jgi:hypothetical protein